MCANSEGSGETARMRRLAWAFDSRLCDKYHNLMSWLKWKWLKFLLEIGSVYFCSDITLKTTEKIEMFATDWPQKWLTLMPAIESL